jgi:hypothetical protein
MQGNTTPQLDPEVKPVHDSTMSIGHKMLLAISAKVRTGKLEIYQGTVPDAVIAKRRAKNKVARAQRKINRQKRKGGATK